MKTFASITPNETITRWETAIAKRRKGTSTLSNPELEIAIQQALDSEQKIKQHNRDYNDISLCI